ncbi:hypothetical protein V1514DRAFT_207215 [Lipomyces japonicus]|uniref:uncharacterized protein n=1 Tax=Lipomyces japonicus TaxID=56871 RepID=UPI0034CEA5B5
MSYQHDVSRQSFTCMADTTTTPVRAHKKSTSKKMLNSIQQIQEAAQRFRPSGQETRMLSKHEQAIVKTQLVMLKHERKRLVTKILTVSYKQQAKPRKRHSSTYIKLKIMAEFNRRQREAKRVVHVASNKVQQNKKHEKKNKNRNQTDKIDMAMCSKKNKKENEGREEQGQKNRTEETEKQAKVKTEYEQASTEEAMVIKIEKDEQQQEQPKQEGLHPKHQIVSRRWARQTARRNTWRAKKKKEWKAKKSALSTKPKLEETEDFIPLPVQW